MLTHLLKEYIFTNFLSHTYWPRCPIGHTLCPCLTSPLYLSCLKATIYSFFLQTNSDSYGSLVATSLRLLKAMAKENPRVQRYLFDRLDDILAIRCAPKELANLLIEVRKFKLLHNNCYDFSKYLHSTKIYILDVLT